MKKTITTLAIALSVISMAEAQKSDMGQQVSKPTPDAVLISTTIEGDYKVCKWRVKQSNEAGSNDFAMMYQTSITQLISTYDKNSKELKELGDFIEKITDNKEKAITQINITGYASPDGSAATNDRISMARAEDMRNYINEEYNLSKCNGTTKGVAYSWADAEELIEESSIPSKSRVLQIIGSSKSEAAIEADLHTLPSSWEYLCRNILPKMRSVEMDVLYSEWREMTTRQPIRPKREEMVVQNSYYIINEQSPAEIIGFENPTTPLDFEEDKWKWKDNRHRDKLKEERRGMYGRRKTLFKYKK